MLNSKKEKGTKRSLKNRLELLHFSVDSIMTVKDGKTPIVTANMLRTERAGMRTSANISLILPKVRGEALSGTATVDGWLWEGSSGLLSLPVEFARSSLFTF